jgi:carboxylesterase
MTKLWTDVRAGLGLIQQPLLLFPSAAAGADVELSSSLVVAGTRSAVRREMILENNLHLATLDNDADLIFERSADFLAKQLTPAGIVALTPDRRVRSSVVRDPSRATSSNGRTRKWQTYEP